MTNQRNAPVNGSNRYLWVLLGLWPLAQMASWAVVGPLVIVSSALLETVPKYNFEPRFNPSALTFALAAVLVSALGGALLALLSGLLPWLVIQPLLGSSRSWLPARILFGALLGVVMVLPSALLVTGARPGDLAVLSFQFVAWLAICLLVWFLFRRRVVRWWSWLLAHTVGAAVGTFLALLVLAGVAAGSAGSPMGKEQDRIWLRQTVLRFDPQRAYTADVDFEGLNEALAMRHAAPIAGALGGLVGGGISAVLLIVLARDRFPQ